MKREVVGDGRLDAHAGSVTHARVPQERLLARVAYTHRDHGARRAVDRRARAVVSDRVDTNGEAHASGRSRGRRVEPALDRDRLARPEDARVDEARERALDGEVAGVRGARRPERRSGEEPEREPRANHANARDHGGNRGRGGKHEPHGRRPVGREAVRRGDSGGEGDRWKEQRLELRPEAITKVAIRRHAP